MRRLLSALAIAGIASIARPAGADLTLSVGGDWRLEVKAVVTACVLGRCQSESAVETDASYLPAGSIVRMEARVFSCSIPLGDYGDFVPGKRGRVKVKIVQLRELAALVRDCSPYPSSRLRRVKGSEILAADGRSFQSKVRIRLTFQESGQTVGVTVKAKVIGTLLSDATGTLDNTSGRIASSSRGDIASLVVEETLRRAITY